MQVSSVTRPARAWTAPRAAAPQPATAGPADRATVSPPAPDRKWLWTSLASANLLMGSAVPGPLGPAMSQAQRDGVREILRELERGGAQFVEDRGFWNGILSSRHTRHRADGAMRLVEQQRPTFQTALSIQRGADRLPLRSLSDLRDAAALYGVEPAANATDPALAGALRRLAERGWTMQISRDYDKYDMVGPLGAYRTMLEGNPNKDAYYDRKVRMSNPAGKQLWVTADLVPSLDYFYGSGSAEGLQKPDWAQKLKEVAAHGVEIQVYSYHGGMSERPESDPFHWYHGLQNAREAYLLLHGHAVEKIDPKNLDEAVRRHGEWQRLDETVLQPAVKQGLIPKDKLRDFLYAMSSPPDLEPEQKMRLALGILAAGKDFSGHLALYTELARAGHKGEAFTRAATRAAELAREFGPARAGPAVRFLETEVGTLPMHESQRAETAAGYLRLLRFGAGHKLAVQAGKEARLRVDASTYTERIDQLARLIEAGRHQNDYEGLCDDYRAVLENRRPGEPLADAVRPLAVLLEALSTAGKAELAREVYAYIRQGLEHQTLAGTENELVGRYLETLLLTGPEAARKSLERAPDKAPGTVHEGHERVTVGGVVVPKKRG